MYHKELSFQLSDYDEHILKITAAKASQYVVSVTTRNVPVDICPTLRGYTRIVGPPPKEVIYFGCGIVIDCQPTSISDYLSIVLAPACLFKRPEHIALDQIQTEIRLVSGLVYPGRLLACDFHNNLAIVTINSPSPLPTQHLKHIDDVLSIDIGDQTLSRHPTLRPHSRLFKVTTGTPFFSVSRGHTYPRISYPGTGTLCLSSPKHITCDEVYEVKETLNLGFDGAPILNNLGDIIGVVFDSSCFLPSNILSRWWTCYNTFGKFCRPFLGMKVINLHEMDLDFLTQFIIKFPGISTAVVVTKVEEDSPAYHAGIVSNDVVVNFENNRVHSKIKFYEAVWDSFGKAVTLDVLRLADGDGVELKASLVVQEASPDKLQEWPHPRWDRIW